jgi:hypothetical protein
MAQSHESDTAALAGLRAGLEADGYELAAQAVEGGRYRVEITATENACEDCLVPKPLMARLVASALDVGPDHIELRYPNES